MKFENANVLITGGASGIGRIIGQMALQKGAKSFIIWDINKEGIENTCKELGKYGNVRGYIVDVSNNETVIEKYQETIKDCESVDILIDRPLMIRSVWFVSRMPRIGETRFS